MSCDRIMPLPQKSRSHLQFQCLYACFRVHAVISLCIDGFFKNMAQVFSISRQCVAWKNHAPITNVKSHRQFKWKNATIPVRSLILLHTWKNFKIIWHKCLPYQDNVARERTTSQRSMSHFHFQCWYACFRVQAVISLCKEWFIK